MPKVALLNDTYGYYHWGCTATSGAIRKRLCQLGFEVHPIPFVYTVKFDSLPERLDQFDDPKFFRQAQDDHPELFDTLAGVDAVVVNGEGSLHRIRRISLALLYLAHASKFHLGRKVHLINQSAYPEVRRSPIDSQPFQLYRHVFKHLDSIAFREHVSHRLFHDQGIEGALSFDCLPLTLAEEYQPEPRSDARKIVVAGSSAFPQERIADLADFMQAARTEGYEIEVLVGGKDNPDPEDAEFVQALRQQSFTDWKLVDATSLEQWCDCLNSASLFVSGRFHHTIAATFLGTPCVVMEGNTLKNEALTESFGYDPPLGYEHPHFRQELRERAARALARQSVDSSVLDMLCERAERNFDGLRQAERDITSNSPGNSEERSPSLWVCSDTSHGHTAFFRNRPLLQTLFAQLERAEQATFDVLFHACSIGAEVYSFAIAARLLSSKTFRLFATDENAEFLEHAKNGVYPVEVLEGLSAQESSFFTRVDAHEVQVALQCRNEVQFLAPESFVQFQSTNTYDVVFLLNALVYVDASAQSQAIKNIATYNTGFLLTTAFHMETIKTDLDRCGYMPVTNNLEAIHDAWWGRRQLRTGFMVPGITYTSPALGPFSHIDDYEWKYCALFRRGAVPTPS
jgi:chemotaxis methyl-accepting protein methylase